MPGKMTLDEQVRAIERMHANGASVPEIAEAVGMSVQKVTDYLLSKIRFKDARPTALPPDEEKRVLAMTPEERSDWIIEQRERRFLDCRPSVSERVTTGAELWADGLSPNLDELERASGGRFRLALDDEPGNGTVIECQTGRRLTRQQLKARLDYELAMSLDA
jgi:hypothetical protein